LIRPSHHPIIPSPSPGPQRPRRNGAADLGLRRHGPHQVTWRSDGVVPRRPGAAAGALLHGGGADGAKQRGDLGIETLGLG